MELKETIKQGTTTYYSKQRAQASVNYERSSAVLADLLYMHDCTVGILEDVITKYIGIEGKTNETIHEKLWLISAFYQNIDSCEKLIKEARYTAAAPVLRQEFEILTKLFELNENKYNKSKVAKISYFKDFGSLYGQLSEMSHLLKDDVSELFRERDEWGDSISIVSLLPQFNEDTCVMLYGIHIFFILLLILEIEKMFEYMYDFELDSRYKSLLSAIAEQLVEKKIIQYKE